MRWRGVEMTKKQTPGGRKREVGFRGDRRYCIAFLSLAVSVLVLDSLCFLSR